MYRKNNFERLFILVFILSAIFVLNVAYAKPLDAIDNSYVDAKCNFNVGFSDARIKDGKGADLNNSYVRIIGDNSLVINAKDLEYPGAGIEFEATVVNKGTLPAKLIGINTYGINDNDDIKVKTSTLNDKILNPGEKENVSIIVYWDSKSNSQINLTKNFTIELGYEQSI